MRASLGLFLLVATVGGASGATLGVSGDYGNPAGCKYLRDSIYGDDSTVVLTADRYETFVTLCEFIQVAQAHDGSSVATVLCGHEGEESQTVEFLHVAKALERDAYDVFSVTGELMATVSRCE